MQLRLRPRKGKTMDIFKNRSLNWSMKIGVVTAVTAVVMMGIIGAKSGNVLEARYSAMAKSTKWFSMPRILPPHSVLH
jgi:hypothetical protein